MKDYEEGQTLLTQVQDAEAKWELLESETLFNQAITRSLEDILQADKALNETESTLDTGRVHEIAENIEQLTSRIENLTNSNAKEINRGRLLRIHEAAVEGLTTAAASMVVFTKTNGEQQVTVNHGNHGQCTMNEVK